MAGFLNDLSRSETNIRNEIQKLFSVAFLDWPNARNTLAKQVQNALEVGHRNGRGNQTMSHKPRPDK